MSAPECPSCGFENRRGALFCGSCGVSLGKPCPACGEVVQSGLVYCTACGAEVAAAPAPTPSAEERKVVTVLFADLVGFTGRAEALDPEDVRGLLSPYHTRLKAELERFGGTVEKFIGDAVMALFGAPLAREDDAERAVRAALAIREAIAELNAADPPPNLRVRVGITTGEAVVDLRARPSAGEGMAAGDVVNVAARLQAAAPPDGIIVDESTHRATAHTIDYREMDPVAAKGRAQPVPVWEVLGSLTRLGVDIAFRGGAELVGRRRELQLLLDALSQAEAERSPQLVTLVGVPGIGKSRLVFELYAALEARAGLVATWRQGRSLPYGEGVSFWALGEMVKSQAGILESDDARAAGEKLSAAARALLPETEAEWVATHLGPLVGLGGAGEGGPDRQSEAFAAWLRFLDALAETRPLILVFEDLHWADEGLLDFVDHLVNWATGVPLLVVCTARPELLDRRPGWGGGKRNALTVSLSSLSDEETARLLEALGAETHSALLAKAGGNPLYAEEFARMLAQRVEDGELPLPDSVQGIIAARLDTLPADEKALLQDAAVIGKVFWVGALASVVRTGREAVDERLRTLERKEFVRRERRSSVAGETAYVFRHVLVRDVAYGQLPRARRAQTHRLTAEWIESLTGDRSEDVADLLAHHYLSAVQFARATGQPVDELSERARLALREAGDRALALNAFESASRFFEEALTLWPADDSEHPELLFQLGVSLHYQGAEGKLLSEAAEELLDAGSRERAAEAHALLAEAFWHQGRRNETFAELESAGGLLEQEPPSRAKASVLADLARFWMIADEAEVAMEAGGEAYRMANALGLEELRAHTLNTIGVARVMAGDRGGLGDLEQSLEIALGLRSPLVLRAYNNLASMHADLGDLARAAGLYDQGAQAGESFRATIWFRWLVAERMNMRYWQGRWDEALRIADELTAEIGTRHLREIEARVVRTRIALARGDESGALEEAGGALAFAREARDPQVVFPALAAYGFALHMAGRSEEGGQCAEEVLELWRGTPSTLGSYWVADIAFVLSALGREAELLEAAERARTPTLWLEAVEAAALGDWPRAAGTFARIGSLPDEALARLHAAELHTEADRPAEAEEELRRALAFYRGVGASAYVRRGEGLTTARS